MERIDIKKLEEIYKAIQNKKTKSMKDLHRLKTIEVIKTMRSGDLNSLSSIPYEILIIASIMDLRNKRRLEVIEEYSTRLWLYNVDRYRIRFNANVNSINYSLLDTLNNERVVFISKEFNANGMERQTRIWFDTLIVNLFKDVTNQRGNKISLEESLQAYKTVTRLIKEVRK